LADELSKHGAAVNSPETGLAVVGTATGITALVSAAACCVLPLALAAFGLGAGGLAAFVPYHLPLTIGAAVAVLVGWLLYFRKRRACAQGAHDAECAIAPSRATSMLLGIATAAVALSAVWPSLIERPLMRLLGGA
jgi:mercuric ion transport protein